MTASLPTADRLVRAASAGAAATRVLVGTYAAKDGPGMVPIARDRDGWRIKPPLAHVRNASWAVVSPRHGLHYVVDEVANTVSVHRGPGWNKVAALRAGGEAPCHLALSPDERRLLVANYSSGSITVITLDEEGMPADAGTWQGEGGGPDTERQAGPHGHWVGFGFVAGTSRAQ